MEGDLLSLGPRRKAFLWHLDKMATDLSLSVAVDKENCSIVSFGGSPRWLRSSLSVATFNPALGSRVWVEDPDEAWLDGEVVEINGEQIEVLFPSGKQVTVNASNIYIRKMSKRKHLGWRI